MGILLRVIFVLVLVAIVVVCIVFGPAEFVIAIQEKKAQVRRGKVSSRFLSAVEDLIAASGVERGRITGVRRGDRVVLRVSRTIPPALHQRITNLWQLER